MSITSASIARFLKAVLSVAVASFDDEKHRFSRIELLRIFQSSFPTSGDFSETMDNLFFYDLMDAASKMRPEYSDFFLTNKGIEFLKNPSDFQLSESEIRSELQREIDSTDWTGLSKKIGPAYQLIIRQKADGLLQAIIQSDADTNTKLNACKRVEAVIALLDAPNTPWAEIISLLAHPSVSAFFAATSLLQLLIGLAT